MKVSTIGGVLLVFLFVTMPVYAQEQGSKTATNDSGGLIPTTTIDGRRRHDTTADAVAKLQSQLNLTPDQVTAITPIIGKYISKRQELRQSAKDGTLDKGDMHGQLEQLREDENQELAQILSQDQMSQWSNMQNHARHKYAAGASEGSSEAGQ